jgi:hypothetical protein
MSVKEIAKRNDLLRKSIPSRCKGFRPNSAHSYLLIRSKPFAENISILQVKKRGSSQSLRRYQKVPGLQSFGFLKS